MLCILDQDEPLRKGDESEQMRPSRVQHLGASLHIRICRDSKHKSVLQQGTMLAKLAVH